MQAVSVYFVRRKRLFLAMPNSECGEHGPSISHGPVLSVAAGEADEEIGQMVLELRNHSKTGIPTPDLRNGVDFPIVGIPGLRTWGSLRSGSPLYVGVDFTPAGILCRTLFGDGRGYSADRDAKPIELPLTAAAAEIGACLRSILDGDD